MKNYVFITLCLTAFFLVVGTVAEMCGDKSQAKAAEIPSATEKALFAGGCFWCMESPFEALEGVISVTSGYAGGTTTNPTYQDYGEGGHIEVVQIIYDPQKVSYAKLLDTFWQQIDPTDAGGQFADRGHSYITGIFYYNDRQKESAEESKKLLGNSGIFSKPIVTAIEPAAKFWPAEEYHQDYYRNNSLHYYLYRAGSGRDIFLETHWKDRKFTATKKDQNQDDLRSRLTPLQYAVTQENDTEPPFENVYWDNKESGIYVDVVSGEPLFSSKDKYDSGTGWPSFTQPLVQENIVEHSDISLFGARTEVRSKEGNSHLGHVFNDGPAPTGLRYCINSASLRFIPADRLDQEGLAAFSSMFHD